MKRFSSPETLGAMVYPSHEEKKIRKKNFVYGTEFQAMLDGLDDEDYCTEESSQSTEKKRRLSLDQVKALEKIFEVDNRLEPQRKAKVAEELGLQPRQVAIWFQNRRARWKTKQLERDYGLLEANYEALKLNYNKLEKEKEALIAELKELRGKLGEENTEINRSVKEEALLLVSKNNVVSEKPELTNPDSEVRNNGNSLEIKDYVGFKDGLSDSNCSGDFNIGSNKNAQLLTSPAASSLRYSSWLNCLQFLDSRAFPHQFVKMEEQSLFSTEESGNFFSVDQAPTLQRHH